LLLDYVFAKGWENDFSFDGVERVLLENYGDRMFGPITSEQEAAAKAALAPNGRSAAEVNGFNTSWIKLPPFMRSNPAITE